MHEQGEEVKQKRSNRVGGNPNRQTEGGGQTKYIVMGWEWTEIKEQGVWAEIHEQGRGNPNLRKDVTYLRLIKASTGAKITKGSYGPKILVHKISIIQIWNIFNSLFYF